MAEQIFSGKYLVQREIARGGMGVVYLALDQTLHRQVAIKVLHAHYMGDASFAQRFLREARAMARLNHENIIQIYAVEEDQGNHYIVMEYFPSKELKQLLKDHGPLDLAGALRFAIAMTRALTYAHGKGIIHRDIKPGNMMIGEGDILKLTDFGIAAALGESSATVTGTIMGTPEYMSPEQARGDKVDAGTDMYSLGMVLYEMLTGSTPYKGLAGQTIMGKLAYSQEAVEWPFPEHIPSSLRYLICSMTKKMREERFADSSVILETLKGHLDQLTSLVLPPPSLSSDDATLDLSSFTQLLPIRSKTPVQQEPEKPKTREASEVGPQEPYRSKASPPSPVKPITIEDSATFSRHRGMSPAIMAVVASVFIVGGVLLFLQQWPGSQNVNNSEPISSPVSSKPGELGSVTSEIPSVEALIAKMSKLADQWGELLVQHKARAQQSDVDLIAVERQVSRLGGSENKLLDLQMVGTVEQQVKAVDRAFQATSARYQSGVGGLQKSMDGLLAEMEVLTSQDLDGETKDRLSQASQKLQDLAGHSNSYQKDFEVTWDKRMVALRQNVEGVNRRVVKREPAPQPKQPESKPQGGKLKQENRDLQPRVDAWTARITDEREKVKGMGKILLMSLQSFQKQIHELKQNVGSFSAPNRQQLDVLSQTLEKLNGEYFHDQERYRDELEKSHQNIQDVSNELNLLKTSGLEASTLKEVMAHVQPLEEILRELEASQKETSLAWRHDAAKIQDRLQEAHYALAQDEKKDEDLKKTNIQELETIVGDIQQWYQNRDLAALQLGTNLSPKQAEILRALFANWPSFTVHVQIDSIDQDSAKVIVQLHEMVDKRGNRAKAHQEEIIGRQVLYIPNQGGEWGKPRW